MDGQGGDPGLRSGRAHRLRPGRQHLAAVCPSTHRVHPAGCGSRTGLDRCGGAGLGHHRPRRGSWKTIDGGRGAAYDPAADRCLDTDPSAGRGAIAPEAASAWTGSELIIWSSTTSQDGLSTSNAASAYNPRSNRWRPLSKAPVPGRAMPLTVWTGDRAIFIGGMNLGDRPRMDRGNIAAITQQGAAYRPVGP